MNFNLTINPSKLSQPAGAALAFMGVKNTVPLWHGVQGCTAFAKNLFIAHFREPMPFQNTAISQANVIMGSDENIIEAMTHLKDKADLIGLFTTGVAETSGVDLNMVAKRFRDEHPKVPYIHLNTPDFVSNLSKGYAKTVSKLLETFTPGKTRTDAKMVVVLPGPYITPGEIEALRAMIRSFALEPYFCPDLGDSLYGYLQKDRFYTHSNGGISIADIEKLSNAALVFSIGSSMEKTGKRFAKKHNISVFHFDNLSVLDEIDHFFQILEQVSSKPTPEIYRRHRKHYLDTLLDTDFYFQGRRIGIAGETEFVKRWKAPLDKLEVESLCLTDESVPGIVQGDFSDFAEEIHRLNIEILVGNTHIARLASEFGIPVVRSGIPVTDRFGEPQAVRLGYDGAARQLMELGNAVLQLPLHHAPYVSPLQQTLVQESA